MRETHLFWILLGLLFLAGLASYAQRTRTQDEFVRTSIEAVQ